MGGASEKAEPALSLVEGFGDREDLPCCGQSSSIGMTRLDSGVAVIGHE